MKKLADNTEVSSRGYYFLLDWNEKDEHRYMASHFKKIMLNELTIHEYKLLFTFATLDEIHSLDLADKV